MKFRWLIFIWIFLTCNVASAYLPADWMYQLFHNKPQTRLTAVAIPGTHNAATCHITPFSSRCPKTPYLYGFARPFVAGWSKTQFTSVYHQLLNGIRFLDLRIAYRKEKAYVVHGLISISLEKVAKQLLRFAIEHPKEVVLVWLTIVYEVKASVSENEFLTMRERARQQVRDTLGSYHLPFSHQLTFADAWNTRASISLIEDFDIFWPNAITPEEVQRFIAKSFRERNADRFNEMQFILTPNSDPRLLLAPLLHVNFAQMNNSLSVFSAPLRRTTNQMIQDFDAQGNRFNIVSTDFVSLFPFAQTVIDLNAKNFPG